MNVYERSYKRVRADGLSQPDLLETLRAEGVFRAFAPLQQPLVEELVAQLDRQARQRRGSVRVLLTPDRLYLSVEIVLRRCAFETPASRCLFDALAQNAASASTRRPTASACLRRSATATRKRRRARKATSRTSCFCKCCKALARNNSGA